MSATDALTLLRVALGLVIFWSSIALWAGRG